VALLPIARLASVYLFGLIALGADLHAQSVLIPLTTRRDMVFDHTGNYLYISTADGFVQRYNISSSQLETPYNLGGSLNGIDIATDDLSLLVAQNNVSGSQGVLHKLNLITGAVTNITFSRASYEAGAWDVAIASNGLAFVTTQYYGSGWVPLRQIDLATNSVTIRNDWPRWAVLGINQDTQIHRSADGTALYFLESSYTVFTYDAITNVFGPEINTDGIWGGAAGAVNRNGTLFATRRGNIALDTAPNFRFLRTFNGMDGSAVFDPLSDTLYAVKCSTAEIVAYDTGTFAEKFRLNIGESLSSFSWTQFGAGTLVASPNGRYLALATASGVRVFALPITIPAPSPTPTPSLGTPRDMVFDHSGQHLYISTDEGFVFPYNLVTRTLESPHNLGGSLRGIDIAADDSYLVVAQYTVGVAEGTFQKLNLYTGTVTNLNYRRQYGDEGGGWDVAIGSNGLALVTTDGPIWTPLREINLITNAVSVRNDPPTSDGYSNRVYRQTQIHRGADRTRFYFSGWKTFTYSAASNTFGPSAPSSTALAVNRDGSLLASRGRGTAIDTAPAFSFVHSLGQPDSGVAFDVLTDRLYAVRSSTSEIIAYDTNTFAEQYRLPIGATLPAGTTQFGSGTLVASPDGRYLALRTPSEIRVISIPNPVPSPTPTPTPTLGKPRDMVFDHAGQHLYITTDEGLLFPYNIATDMLETPYDLGGSLRGIDIAADDSFLIVAQYNTGVAQGMFQKVDLQTGTITHINYPHDYYTDGSWDVAVNSNGLAFVSTGGSNFSPLRQINLTTNTISTRTDTGGTLSSPTYIKRSVDGTHLYFFEAGSFPGSLFTYNASTNAFGSKTQADLGRDGYAVNRDGSLAALRLYPNPYASFQSMPNLVQGHSFNGLDGGFVFDAVQDTFYGVNSLTDHIVAYDTNNFTEKFRFDIGENVSPGASPIGSGLMVASPNGRYLALIAPTTVRVYGVPAVQLVSVVSQKNHGGAGTFNIDLPLDGSRAIECRSGGANGNYTLVFTFGLDLTSVGAVNVTRGTATTTSSMIDDSDRRRYIVNLTGVTNGQYVKVTVTNVNDSAGNHTDSISQQMGVLVGDVNANGNVTNADISAIQAQVGALVSVSNFRNDVNANGILSNGDVAAAQARVGAQLPP
jgi:hypothetical protein